MFTFHKRSVAIKFMLIALASLVLVACAWQKPKQFFAEDGRVFYRIECKHKIDQCNEQATKICPNGYNTIHSFSFPMTYSMIGVTQKSDMFYLEIECKQ